MRSESVTPSSATARPTMPWPVVALASAGLFAGMGNRTAFGVLYPAMVADTGWSVADVTSAYSTGLLIYSPVAMVAGLFLDRFGVRAIMLAGCAIVAVGMVAVAAASELWHLYIAYTLSMGIGSAGIGFLTVIKLLSLRAPTRFPTALGIAFTGQGVGALVISPAIQGVIDLAGWRAGAAALAVLAAGLLPMAALLAPGRVAPTERRSGVSTDGPSIWTPAFALAMVANVGLGYQMLLPTHQVAHLLSAGYAPIVAAWIAGAWGALTAVGSLIGGWGIERLGLARLMLGAFALYATGTVALIVAEAGAFWLAAIYVLISGTGRGIFSVGLGTGQTRAFAGPRLGRITGILEIGFGFGAFLGPWLTAIVHDRTGSYSPGIVIGILAAAVTVALVPTVARLAAARRA